MFYSPFWTTRTSIIDCHFLFCCNESVFLLEFALIFCSNIGISVVKKPLLRHFIFVVPFVCDIQHWVAHLKSPGIHHLLDAFTTAFSTTLLQINKTTQVYRMFSCFSSSWEIKISGENRVVMSPTSCEKVPKIRVSQMRNKVPTQRQLKTKHGLIKAF